jgi:8-oxo-dGTP pyrophosphatase MutT (NUDIX family)
MSSAPIEAPRAAATVVVVRNGKGGVETLMLRRNSEGAFADHWVFPGGKVEATDGADELDSARHAAAREAAEEAGIVLDPHNLVTLNFWLPPATAPRRFATWFFVAEGSEEEIHVDGTEIHEHAWLPPTEVMARSDEGITQLAPPTWMTLHVLSEFADVAALLAWARNREPEHFETRVARLGDQMVCMWHGDAGYESGDLGLPGPRHRLTTGRPWRFERTP